MQPQAVHVDGRGAEQREAQRREDRPIAAAGDERQHPRGAGRQQHREHRQQQLRAHACGEADDVAIVRADQHSQPEQQRREVRHVPFDLVNPVRRPQVQQQRHDRQDEQRADDESAAQINRPLRLDAWPLATEQQRGAHRNQTDDPPRAVHRRRRHAAKMMQRNQLERARQRE